LVSGSDRVVRYRRRRKLGRTLLLAVLGVGASAGFVLGRASKKIDLEVEPLPLSTVTTPEDEDVCCRQPDGIVSIMFLSECRQNRGKAVERRTGAAALKPVCCKRIGLSDWSDAQSCNKRGGSVVDDMSCRTQYDLICCEFPRTSEMPSAFVAWAGRDQCTKDHGTERPRARCEDPLENVCCQQPGNPRAVAESSRQNCQLKGFREVASEQCAQVCCHHNPGGTRWEPKASCGGGGSQIASSRECDDVCCKMPGKRNLVAKEGDCRDRGGMSAGISECGTTVEVEKPKDVTESSSSAPPPASTDPVADRPPASTPMM
jgi:hypothetical protein